MIHLFQRTEEEFFKFRREEERRRLDYESSVFSRPEHFKGWHLAFCQEWKPGVVKFCVTQKTVDGRVHMRNGFCGHDILRVARETGLIAKSDGYMTAV